MGKSYFRFKQFTIQQDACAMKVGTDGIVLGAWAELATASQILDIGSGTGLLALMAAQRNPQAQIVGVEIDPSAAKQAQENAERSAWSNRIDIRQEAIQQHEGQYDVILCNPPYFTSGKQRNSPSAAKARHAIELSHLALIQSVQRVLLPGGHFFLILPVQESVSFLEFAAQHHLFPSRLTEVRSRPNRDPFRFLIDLGRSQQAPIHSQLTLHDESGITPHPEFRKLASAFYLDW